MSESWFRFKDKDSLVNLAPACGEENEKDVQGYFHSQHHEYQASSKHANSQVTPLLTLTSTDDDESTSAFMPRLYSPTFFECFCSRMEQNYQIWRTPSKYSRTVFDIHVQR